MKTTQYKTELKTVIKSVTLISKEEKEIPQPENLVLNGAKLGSKRDNAWIDDNFAINWNKVGGKYAQCGWKVEKLVGKSEKEGWRKSTKAFNFSEGVEIVLEPLNGVYKENAKLL